MKTIKNNPVLFIVLALALGFWFGMYQEKKKHEDKKTDETTETEA